MKIMINSKNAKKSSTTINLSNITTSSAIAIY